MQQSIFTLVTQTLYHTSVWFFCAQILRSTIVGLFFPRLYAIGMRWTYYNPNPIAARTGDCTVRAISKLTGQTWEQTYIDLCAFGLMMCDLPAANSVWGGYLRSKGFHRYLIPDTCPDCYTVNDFAEDHPNGDYLLALNGHVVAVMDGHYFDSWDSGAEVPIYYWQKEG